MKVHWIVLERCSGGLIAAACTGAENGLQGALAFDLKTC
jgi:hypothetical protein